MRYVVWFLRLVIFIIVLLFALRNTAPVDVGLFGGAVLRNVPLIVVMLAAFALGGLLGWLVAALAVLRRRREINRLRRTLAQLQARTPAAAASAGDAADVVVPAPPL